MSNIAKIFKSKARYMSYPTSGYGLIHFSQHRCIIPIKGNEKKIKFIETVLLEDPRLGIYVDENEKEVDLANVPDPSQMKNEEVLHLLRTQAAKVAPSTSPNGSNIGASSAADLQGKTGPATARFLPATVQRALEQQASGTAPTDGVGEDLKSDPDALARKLLGK